MAGIDSFTKLYLMGGEADASTTIVDSSLSPHTMTCNNNAQADTAQSKFTSSSILFDGTGDWVSSGDSDDWNFGSGSFTIDLWARFASTAANGSFVSQYVTADRAFVSRWITSNNLDVRFYNAAVTEAAFTFSWTPSIDTWYHLAIVKNGTDLMAFVDGTQIGVTQTYSDTIKDAACDLQIGAFNSGSNSFNGWLAGARISKGVARWTGNFTPPVAVYSVDASFNSKMMMMGVS